MRLIAVIRFGQTTDIHLPVVMSGPTRKKAGEIMEQEKKRTKKSKRKPKPVQTESIARQKEPNCNACFPTEAELERLKSDPKCAEARGVNFPPKEYPEDPRFPGKQLLAGRQCTIDLQSLVKVNTFQEFVMLLKGILPYWIERWHFNPVCAQNVMLCIRQRGAELRKQDGVNVVAIPDDFYGQQDWLTDAEKALGDHILYIDKTTKQVAWDPDNPDYISLKDAAEKSGGLHTASALGKHIRKKGDDIRWMTYGQRSRVNKSDYESHIKTIKNVSAIRERHQTKTTSALANKHNIQ